MHWPDPHSTLMPLPAADARIATEEAYAPPEVMEIYQRIITAGVFDRFPKLRMIIGHNTEAVCKIRTV